MQSSPRRRPERFFWIGVSAFLLAAVVLVALVPSALAQNRDAERREMMETFQRVFEFVQQNYVDETKVDSRTLMEGALKGLFDALGDPYSSYLKGEDLRVLEDTTTGEYSGIGVVISKEDGAAGAEVVTPIEGTPAYRAGVSAADLILKVNGEETRELTLNDIVDKIRGPNGTDVTLTVQRGKSLTFDVTLRRETLELPTVKRAMLPGSIGYLRISQFTPHTARDVSDAIKFFAQSSYRALVVDVRSNGGGRLDSVVQIADYFLDSGPIVSTRGRTRAESFVWSARASDTLVPPAVPVLVLINGGSASASEILAGALKDTGRARVIGETSYGKGTVQQIRNEDGFEFKLTMSRYYTPAGTSIDGKGIEPDVVVKDEGLAEGELDAYNRLIKEQRIRSFVESFQGAIPGERETTAFIESLAKEGFQIRERYLRKLVRDEVNRTNNNPPVYDLDYDVVLQKAVELLSSPASQAASR